MAVKEGGPGAVNGAGGTRRPEVRVRGGGFSVFLETSCVYTRSGDGWRWGSEGRLGTTGVLGRVWETAFKLREVLDWGWGRSRGTEHLRGGPPEGPRVPDPNSHGAFRTGLESIPTGVTYFLAYRGPSDPTLRLVLSQILREG